MERRTPSPGQLAHGGKPYLRRCSQRFELLGNSRNQRVEQLPAGLAESSPYDNDLDVYCHRQCCKRAGKIADANLPSLDSRLLASDSPCGDLLSLGCSGLARKLLVSTLKPACRSNQLSASPTAATAFALDAVKADVTYLTSETTAAPPKAAAELQRRRQAGSDRHESP